MKKLSTFLILFTLNLSLFANGGIPWEDVTIKDNGGRVSFKNDAEIKLSKENLNIRFVDDSVIVSCSYYLFNSSSTDKNIDFAFNLTDCWHKNYPDYYFIYQNGQKIDSTLKIENIFQDNNEPYVASFNEYSKLSLKAKTTTKIDVLYRIKTQNDGKHLAGIFNDNTFIYNLFPALSFGDGIIDEFTLTIDKSDLSGYNGFITDISGLDFPFNSSENILSKTFNKFDLKAHKELKISYNIKNWYMSDMIKKYRITYQTPAFNSYNTSSYLSDNKEYYPAWYLNDGDYMTPWVEGKKDAGIGEKITYSFKGPCLVTHILIVNGFRKSEKTYTENCRLKKIALYVDGKLQGTYELPDKPFSLAMNSNILETGDLLPLSEKRGLYPEQSLEIEILEVWPGSKYLDTCVSEIILLKAPIPSH